MLDLVLDLALGPFKRFWLAKPGRPMYNAWRQLKRGDRPMRSQLFLLSLVSIAVSGCGKDVSRDGNTAAALQAQQANVATNGPCLDPIDTVGLSPIERYSDVAPGNYTLQRFDAVGIAEPTSSGASAGEGISVISGTPEKDGTFTLTKCQDLSAMPGTSYTWSVDGPEGLSAPEVRNAENIHIAQTVSGPGVVAQNGPQAPSGPQAPIEPIGHAAADACTTALLSGEGCAEAQLFQIDPTTIGVLRTVDTEKDGLKIQSRIFVRYALSGGGSEAPRLDPTPPSAPTPIVVPVKSTPPAKKIHPAVHHRKKKHHKKSKAPIGDGATKKTPTRVTPSSEVPTSPTASSDQSCYCQIPPAPPSPEVENVKAKTEVGEHEGTVEAPASTNPSAKNANSKEKSEVKLKQTTADSTVKLKSREKVVTDSNGGTVKVKSDFKLKIKTPTTSLKIKRHSRVRTSVVAPSVPVMTTIPTDLADDE